MKLSAVEIMRKFFYEKGFRNVSIQMNEDIIEGISNGVSLTFTVEKGNKVRINSINFSGNEQVEDTRLKKQMKGTKEMPRFTLFPEKIVSPYGDSSKGYDLKSFVHNRDFLSPTKILSFLDPYLRVKFSGAKFNETKYQEDKEKVLEYYNAQGLRDAQLVADTQVLNNKGKNI